MTKGYQEFPTSEPFVSSHPKLLSNDKNALTSNADTTPPLNPKNGMKWYDTTNKVLKMYREDTKAWHEIPTRYSDGNLNIGHVSGTIYTNSNSTMRRTGTDGFLQLGMENVIDGARLNLYGKNHTNKETCGGFELLTGDGEKAVRLVGKPNGWLGWEQKSLVRSVDGVLANALGNVDLGAIAYKKTTSVRSLAGSFWFDTRSGITDVTTDLPDAFDNSDWVGLQIGTSAGNDRSQFLFNGPTVWYRSDDANLGAETWNKESWQKITLYRDGNVVVPHLTSAKGWTAIARPDVTKGTLPSKDLFSQLYFRDGAGGTVDCEANVLGAVETGIRSNGNSDVKVYSNKNIAGVDERAQLLVGWKKNPDATWTPYATAPVTYNGANHGEIVTAGWANKQYIKTDGTSIVSGTIKSSVVNGTFVNAANGATIINSTAADGQFAPLWQYTTTEGGSFVLNGHKNALAINYITKEDKASGTNKSKWVIGVNTNGGCTFPEDVFVGGKFWMKGAQTNKTVAYLDSDEGTQDNFVLAGANQSTYICSGESGYFDEKTSTFRKTLNRSGEDLVLVSDNNVVIAANAQNLNTSEVRKVEIDTVGNIRFPARLYPSLENGIWSNSPYVLRHGTIDRDTIPAQSEFLYIPFYGKSGVDNKTNRLAKIEYGKFSSGVAQIAIGVNNPSNTSAEVFCGIISRWRKSGDAYVADNFLSHHPGSTSNDMNIATTKWVRDTLMNGTISTVVKAKSFQATSDSRLKEEQKDVLYDLSSLKPKHYKFKGDNEFHVGLIAQDVEKVIPEAVGTDENGYKSLDYNAIVAALVGEVNALKEEVARLKEAIG